MFIRFTIDPICHQPKQIKQLVVFVPADTVGSILQKYATPIEGNLVWKEDG